MTVFLVTTVVDAYETYVVDAPSEETARAIVASSEMRAMLAGNGNSFPDGHGDDEVVVAVRERKP